MKTLKTLYYQLITGLIILLSPRLAFAQIENPLAYNDLSSFLNALLDVIIQFSIPIVIVAIVVIVFPSPPLFPVVV